jgi:hypothetical protein
MAYAKQTVFTTTLEIENQIRSDSVLVAIMTAKEDDMVNRNIYDRNVNYIQTTVGGIQYLSAVRKWPTQEAAQEWHDYGSEQTAARGYTWQSFDIQSI